ncbi:MAG: hypothetical protein FD138_360 [Planctomycetota bacterium]|nr:MAG: hypothetical protein FD138_360 [Planctomycetota bacterium]
MANDVSTANVLMRRDRQHAVADASRKFSADVCQQAHGLDVARSNSDDLHRNGLDPRDRGPRSITGTAVVTSRCLRANSASEFCPNWEVIVKEHSEFLKALNDKGQNVGATK